MTASWVLLFIALQDCRINVLQLKLYIIQVLKLLWRGSIEIDPSVKTDAEINLFGDRTANKQYFVLIYIIKLAISLFSLFLIMEKTLQSICAYTVLIAISDNRNVNITLYCKRDYMN